MTMEYVDAHCHLDLYESPSDIVKLVEAHRIHTIAVTNAPFVFDFTLKLSAGCRYIHAAVGMHPELIATHYKRLNDLWPLITQTQFIGEVGLDYVTKDETIRDRQRAAFRRILDTCAASGDKVITIHSRRAATEVIEMVGPAFPGTIILHWFSGSKTDLRKAVQYGFYFSVNREMLFSKSGVALIAEMPRNRLLTETDGPYTADENARANPTTVIRTCVLLGELWKLDPIEAATIVRQNFGHVAKLEPVA